MSGISPGPNKFVSCDNCPDRTIKPNCHTTCKGYIFRQEKNEEKKQRRQEELSTDDYIIRQTIKRRQDNGIKQNHN